MDSLTLSSLSPYYNVFFTALAFLISCLIVLVSRRRKPKYPCNLPPGPPGWPIVGNLFQYTRSGKQLHEYVSEMREKYGPIVTLRLGCRTRIFISSPELVRESLIERGQVFASRPRETPTRNIFSANKFTVNASTYGPIWRSLRRNMVQCMLSPTKLKEFRDLRVKSMDKIVDRLRSEAEANDGLVWILKSARFAFFSILLSMCFGVEMEEKTVEGIDDLMKTILMVVNPRLDDFFPLLSPFFSKQQKFALEIRRKQIETLVPFIDRRRAALKNPGSDAGAASFAYIDTLFDLQIEGRKSSPSDAEIVTLVSEFLNGGTDTTGTAVEWAMARVIDDPNIQSRIYDEIKSTVGDRKVDEADLEKMVYLNAFSKELLRKHPPTPFSLTHAVIEPTTLGGYHIPLDADVDFFMKPMSEDPKLWSDPENFDPDRFITGRDEADIVGVSSIKMAPFGVGRRVCPGLGMATIHVNLMVARLVQEFEWGTYPENSKLDFSCKTEFTVVMKNTLRAKIKPRVAAEN